MTNRGKGVSDEDRARIAALQGVISDVETKIAAILAPYVGITEAKVTHEVHPHKATHGGELKVVIENCRPGTPQHGCYYDPPGVCEPCSHGSG